MTKPVRVDLIRPVPTHVGERMFLEFREPTWDDIMPVGEPYTVHPTQDGDGIVVENNEAILHLAEQCVMAPADGLSLTKLGVSDTVKVRRAIIRFFLPAVEAGAASNTSSTNSASSAGTSLTPSEG